MLSDRSRPVIEATLPVVGEHVALIAQHFYAHMLAAEPQLLDGVFNRGNQAEGSQQVALAGSVAAFATCLVATPEQLPEQLLSRIAHKHASLGIRPDQYQVVHDHLVGTSLPGQYVSVQVLMPDGTHQPRQYSLTRADDGEHRAICVKRVHGGGAPDGEVSNLLLDTLQVGDELSVSLPYGDVVLDGSGRPLVLVSAGIGVTPTAGMLSHLVAGGSRAPVVVLHADEEESTFALRRQVVDDVSVLPGAALHLWYERGARTDLPVVGVHAGLMDLDDVDLPDGAAYHLCGPVPFMKAVRAALLGRGVPARDVRYEVFGPDLWQADAATEPSPGAVGHALLVDQPA